MINGWIVGKMVPYDGRLVLSCDRASFLPCMHIRWTGEMPY